MSLLRCGVHEVEGVRGRVWRDAHRTAIQRDGLRDSRVVLDDRREERERRCGARLVKARARLRLRWGFALGSRARLGLMVRVHGLLWVQIQGRGLGPGAGARVRQAEARRVGQLLLEMHQAVGRHERTREELAGRLVGGLGHLGRVRVRVGVRVKARGRVRVRHAGRLAGRLGHLVRHGGVRACVLLLRWQARAPMVMVGCRRALLWWAAGARGLQGGIDCCRARSCAGRS